MAPLLVEAYLDEQSTWVPVTRLRPEHQPGSFSDNDLENGRRLYVFRCQPDDRSSTVYRARNGKEAIVGELRVIDEARFEVVTTLHHGSLPYEMTIRTDRSPEPRRLRFTHV